MRLDPDAPSSHSADLVDSGSCSQAVERNVVR
jgi:hypothetical protein